MLRILAGSLAAVAALGIGLTSTATATTTAATAATAAAPTAAAPVPVTGLTCDGDTYKCTADLKFGDGRWKARWDASVFHQAPGSAERSAAVLAAPVPVTGLTCDGDTYKCTADLKFGDGRWKARWDASVFHQAPGSAERSAAVLAAPVPVTGLTCDGDTGACTADLKFGDGRWKARWGATIFHQA
ncbi:hypothetical protein OG349_28540 [Streptomyces sp. NBC_01317]|uniref:hypothetical protein n=1 Tax=Streptomyces sp. NBC_01317 TaxID=2903822 RepID=UPI002E0EBF95|nr:hypothetical protein OG349_28540 [Streptomyces sp. NBC_01317]